jgi:hypothetical protein
MLRSWSTRETRPAEEVNARGFICAGMREELRLLAISQPRVNLRDLIGGGQEVKSATMSRV